MTSLLVSKIRRFFNVSFSNDNKTGNSNLFPELYDIHKPVIAQVLIDFKKVGTVELNNNMGPIFCVVSLSNVLCTMSCLLCHECCPHYLHLCLGKLAGLLLLRSLPHFLLELQTNLCEVSLKLLKADTTWLLSHLRI